MTKCNLPILEYLSITALHKTSAVQTNVIKYRNITLVQPTFGELKRPLTNSVPHMQVRITSTLN